MTRIIITVIIFLCLIITYSCQEESGNAVVGAQISNKSNSDKVSTLRILAHWYGEGKKETMVREVAREFSLLNQDVSIDLQFPQTVYSYSDESELFPISYQEIARMIQKNEWPWDIMLCDQARYLHAGEIVKDPNWGAKYLVDFSKEPWFKEAHKKGLFDSGEYEGKYGGIIPGPILEGIAHVMYMSEEVEKMLGIKVKRLDMQLTDFITYAQAVYNYNQSHQEKITLFSLQYNLALSSLFSQLIQSQLGKDEFSSVRESLAALDIVYKACERMSQYEPIQQYTTFDGMTYDAAQRVLKEDRFLFNVEPSWMYLLWNNTNPKGTKLMRPCEIPSMDNKTSPTYSGFYQVIFVVPKNAKNVEAAKRFIEFISSEETAEKWIKYAKCPTGLKSKISYSDFGQEEFELYYRHLQNKYGNNQKEVNLSKLLFNRNIDINFNIENVLLGKMNASEALRAVERQIR